jgi:hypothetical protein
MSGLGYFIPAYNSKNATVVRPIHSVNSSGETAYSTYGEVVSRHRVNLVPKVTNRAISGNQYQLLSTHNVYPQPNIASKTKKGDYYRIDGLGDFRIVDISNFGFSGFCKVLESHGGQKEKSDVSRKIWSMQNIPMGNHLFGSGSFDEITPSALEPFVLIERNSDSSFFINSKSSTQIEFLDRGLGVTPLLSMAIIERTELAEYGFWQVTLGPGDYVFGSGGLGAIPPFSATPGVFGQHLNDGGYFIKNPSPTGFSIIKSGIGAEPSVLVSIISPKHPSFVVKNGLSAGTYNFGEGDFLNNNVYGDAPLVLSENNNDGDHFINPVTYDGFTIQDKGIGSAPNVSVAIIPR